MCCELVAVVERDGFGFQWLESVVQPVGDALGHFPFRIVDDDQVARLALDGSDQIMFGASEVHEIRLPVMIVCSIVDVFATGVDGHSVLDFAAGFAPSSLASPRSFPPQEPVQ